MKVLRINGRKVKCAFCNRNAKGIVPDVHIAMCNGCELAYMAGFMEREIIRALKALEEEGYSEFPTSINPRLTKKILEQVDG